MRGPTLITHLRFDSTNQLVMTNQVPSYVSSREVLELHRFDATGAATKVFTRASLAPNGFVAAGAHLFYWGRVSPGQYPSDPPRLELMALNPAGTVTWELTKGYGYGFKGLTGGDMITPTAAACRGQTCAVAGTYEEQSAIGSSVPRGCSSRCRSGRYRARGQDRWSNPR